MKKNDLVYPVYGRVQDAKDSALMLYYVGYRVRNQIWVIEFNDGKILKALGKFFRLDEWGRKLLSTKKIRKNGKIVGKLWIENNYDRCIGVSILPPLSLKSLIDMKLDIKYQMEKYKFKVI